MFCLIFFSGSKTYEWRALEENITDSYCYHAEDSKGKGILGQFVSSALFYSSLGTHTDTWKCEALVILHAAAEHAEERTALTSPSEQLEFLPWHSSLHIWTKDVLLGLLD